MYTTIEADIEHGVVHSADSSRLPAHAHVLITLLSVAPNGAGKASAKSEAQSGVPRTPNPAIRGKIKVLGDIMASAPVTSWALQ
jgi:hypothetical protein